MQIGLLTHSINPRGGVVHVLELGCALRARGHAVTLIAPAARGQEFFRPTPCEVELARAPAPVTGLAQTVRARIEALRDHLARLLHRRQFDVLHSHDGIGGNALAELARQGRIGGYLRTVHHVDRFADPLVQAWEERSIREATRVLCVSALWRERLRTDFGVHADQVANGVDLKRFSPEAHPGDARTAQRLGIECAEPLVLCIGGIEARKNTRRLLQAFAQLHRQMPRAQLVIAGGASLLDHGAEVTAFRAEATRQGLRIGTRAPVLITGPLPDDAMPALCRLADVLAMPSLLEGFGLAPLEALASGTPVVVSRRQPFTEHFTDDEVIWADPLQADSIAAALLHALARGRHREVPAVCRRYAWSACAAQHEALYRSTQLA
jgi:glycosyltransferase-like protein